MNKGNNKGVKNKLYFAIVATDIVCFKVVESKLYTLIGKAPEYSPFAGRWALIGGMVRPEEVAEDTVSRLLKEKAGIRGAYTEQVYTFSGVDRDPRGRVVSIAYLALFNKEIQDTGKAVLETEWVCVDKLPKLAYDHDEIFKTVLSKLRFSILNTNIARHLITEEFTLSELQQVYESVLGEGMDKRNFRKKILSSGILKDTKRTKKKGVMRPATLFIFK